MTQSSRTSPSYLPDSSTQCHPNLPIVLYFHRHCTVQLRYDGTKLMEAYDMKVQFSELVIFKIFVLGLFNPDWTPLLGHNGSTPLPRDESVRTIAWF